MFKALLSLYSRDFPTVIVYMLQSTEYQPGQYLRWFWRTQNFSQVMHRRVLDKTRRARLLLRLLQGGMSLQFLLSAYLFYAWQFLDQGMWQIALAVFLATPIMWAHLIVIPLAIARILIVVPNEKKLISQSEKIFKDHSGTIIAVAGSYGKTTMKELLGTVLSHGKKVAITPANKNVASSHANFARRLNGDEDILIIEYGEGRPGDVAQFARTTHPDIGIITGIAPAHLDQYPTVEAAAQDIFSLADYLDNKNVYVNAESLAAKARILPTHISYTHKGLDGWRISTIQVNIESTSFTLQKGSKKLKLHSGLLGRHQVGPLAVTAVIGLMLGLTEKQVATGIAETVPFEHRLQPRALGGAWILDDTYNGNIDGIRAGLALLSELPAKRKIYVTPGLVDQGVETEHVHTEMGRLIADAKPNIVVLMQNSTTAIIRQSLESNGYVGEVQIQDDPLYFYTNIEHIVAAGDIVLMQNDWTDNYN